MRSPFAKKYRVTSSYKAHLNRKPPSTNPGTDYGTPVGEPIYAPEGGKFYPAVDKFGGKYFVLNGANYTWLPVHLDRFVGGARTVREGNLVGYSGESGKVTGPHTHLTMFKNGKRVDPEPIINSLDTNTKPIMDNQLIDLIIKLRPDIKKQYDRKGVLEWWVANGRKEIVKKLIELGRGDVILQMLFSGLDIAEWLKASGRVEYPNIWSAKPPKGSDSEIKALKIELADEKKANVVLVELTNDQAKELENCRGSNEIAVANQIKSEERVKELEKVIEEQEIELTKPIEGMDKLKKETLNQELRKENESLRIANLEGWNEVKKAQQTARSRRSEIDRLQKQLEGLKSQPNYIDRFISWLKRITI